jgi:hypothetical protein
MPARQTRVFVKSVEPLEDWAETLIGRVFRPLTQEFENYLQWFWFSRYGSGEGGDSGDCNISSIPDEYKQPLQPGGDPFHRSMRFRFSVPDDKMCTAFEGRAMELLPQYGYRVSDFREYDHVNDAGRDRFLGVENRQAGRAEQRALLTTDFYCVTSKLVIDALVGPDASGRFRMESNDDQSNNPRRSTFQSLLHLFCNITNAPTDVYVYSKASMSLVGFGTFMYPPGATPPGGWDQGVTAHQIRY